LKDWTKILLKPLDSLETAIKVINFGEVRIALVADSNRKLLGTVTDGDIRRALIRHVAMDCAVEEIMNCKPSTALISDAPDLIILEMKTKEILSIPLLDKHDTLMGLETFQSLLKNKKYDNPVFLMAGGFGTRLHPLTKEKPKPLLDIGSRPILETIIKEFIASGFQKFYISTHYKAEMIRDYFGDGSNWGIEIEYLHEERPLGTAGSLGMLPDSVSDLPIVIMNGDILTKINFEYLLDFHYEQGGIATMCIREYDFQVPYGVVNIEDNCVVEIVEKPVQKFFVNAGIYVLDPKLINYVDGVSYIDMPNLLQSMINQGEKVNVFPIYEYWLDIGRIEDYKKAYESHKNIF
jgi:dTDP-glucose pyrophosphorylase/CBS domain-containing protein